MVCQNRYEPLGIIVDKFRHVTVCRNYGERRPIRHISVVGIIENPDALVGARDCNRPIGRVHLHCFRVVMECGMYT